MKKLSVSKVLGVVLLLPTTSFAQTPSRMRADNIGKQHPNLAEAQHLCTEAYQKLVASQRTNKFDKWGHAHKVKDLLDAANRDVG